MPERQRLRLVLAAFQGVKHGILLCDCRVVLGEGLRCLDAIVEGQGIRLGLSAAFVCSFDEFLAFPAIASTALAFTVKVCVMNFVVCSIVPTEIDVFHGVLLCRCNCLRNGHIAIGQA